MAAKWPVSVATNADLSIAVNALSTTLASAIDAVVTSIPLVSTSGFPTVGYVTIDNEVISYTGVSGGSLTGATRGADGTTAAAHLSNAAVGATIVAAHHNSLKDEIIAEQTWLDTVIGKSTTTSVTSALSAIDRLRVTAQGTPGTTVAVAAGVYTKADGTATVTFAGGNSPAFAVVSANSRIDLLTINDAGTVAITQGTQAASPTAPTYPTDKMVLAEVTVSQTTGPAITQAMIKDVRPYLNLGSGGGGSVALKREDYIVGTASGNYTGSLTVFDLVSTYTVGANVLVVTLDGDVQTKGASADYLETDTDTVTFNTALVTGERVSFLWSTTAPTTPVTIGAINQLAYYASAGGTVSGGPTIDNVGRNILINGGMEFWQRNTSFTSPAAFVYTADRWLHSHDGTPTFTVARETSVIDAVGLSSMKVNITAVGGTSDVDFVQYVENFADYRGKTLTLTALVRSSLTTTNIRLTDSTGSTTSSNHPGDSTWRTLTVTRAISSSASTLSVRLRSVGGTGATGTIYFDSIMLTVSPIAMPFVPTDPEIELRQCQRYYEKSYEPLTNPATATSTNAEGQATVKINTNTMSFGMVPFKAVKRIAPTIVFYSRVTGTAGNWTWRTLTGGTSNERATGVDTSMTRGFNGNQAVNETEAFATGHWTADAEI